MGAPGAVLARVLHGHEDRVVAVVDDRAAGLCVTRDGEELLDAAALGAVDGDPVEGIAEAEGAGLTIGRDPEVAFGVERDVA